MARAESESALPKDVPGESRFVETNGVRLHAVDAGPEDGPLVVLLHGFPEFWYGWHDLVRPLANEGYRVLVPDQRGYNLSDKPESVSAYHVDELAADAVGIADALGYDECSVVGHDWGAAVGWWAALHHEDRVSKLVAVNVPHPEVMYRTLKRSWSQRVRSSYALWFQLPALPEAVARAGKWRLVTRSMAETSRPGTFTPTDFDYYREAWNRPGAFTAMLNWYRAMARYRPRPERTRVRVPTLVVWGACDRFLLKSMARESTNYCRDGRLVMLHDATHWVHHEEPVRVSGEVLDFLDELPPGARELSHR